MDIKQAYKTLEVSEGVSEEELKKKYKELARKYHPDIHKDDPDKFKKINEAYQFIKNYKEPSTEIGFDSFEDIFSAFGVNRQRKKARSVSNIFLEQEISFEESVLGTEKEIEIEREIKCDNCNGEGSSKKKNNCAHCDGFGVSTVLRGNITFKTNCQYCRGQSTKEECSTCKGKTYVPAKSKLKVKIPPGIENKNIIQLQGAGHFAQTSIFGDSYSNTLISINVKNNTKLKIDNNDVVFNLNISLLEALEGCLKTVPSIKGDRQIEIPPLSKNKEEIIIKNLGVGLVGNQKIILDISYPNNIDKLISSLKSGE